MPRPILVLFLATAGCDTLLAGPSAGWVVHTHPCSGSRTEALLVEDGGQTLWTGCGDNSGAGGSVALGLYTSTDGGETWGPASTTPTDEIFAAWRVHSIQRAADGLLYVGGRDTNEGGLRVVSVNGSGAVEPVFVATNQLGFSFEVEHFIRTPNGEQVAESNTGGDVLYWSEGATSPVNASSWESDDSSNQILALTHATGSAPGFYGAGSTISQPPTAFVPPDGATPNSGFQMTPVVLGGGFDGELYGIDVDASILVAGVDQDGDVGIVFQSPPLGSTVTDGAAWSFASASDLAPSDPTWFDDVCRSGDRIIVVGRYSIRQDAFGMTSVDGGLTWDAFEFPDGTGPVQICHGQPDGSFWFAGADGFVASWGP